ncbi:MAG TPA: sulfite exporter TauE/SafE family protein [Bacteroidia bacterium]|nr:sulfite exporter TauE/SafE family protein [Bacteroidia bacterium]
MDTLTIVTLLLVGLAAGILSGLVGVGGGIIIVPCLVFFLGYSQLTAQGTSLAVLLLPAGIFAVMNYYKGGYVNVYPTLLIAATFTIGGFLGSKISISLDQATVKKIFASVLLLVSLKMFFGK